MYDPLDDRQLTARARRLPAAYAAGALLLTLAAALAGAL